MLALYLSEFAYATNDVPGRGAISPAPHIALLLPLKSAVFAPAAEALLQGFQAAAAFEPSLPVRIYSSIDESHEIAALYRQAIASGAKAVVGPLTRSGAAALAGIKEMPVPTLALNVVEGVSAEQLYFFGMAVEAEARLTAQLARQQGLQRAVVIISSGALAQRMAMAFEEEWLALGGRLELEYDYKNDPSIFAELGWTPDTVVFLAADAENARAIRPFLHKKLKIYATSQIFLGNNEALTNYDLNGIHFVDMPWLLQADHPAVMIYPHALVPLSVEHERFYALGIDTFRLIKLLLTGKARVALPLDGVSGQIELDDHTFMRSAIPALFSQGKAQPDNLQATPLHERP